MDAEARIRHVGYARIFVRKDIYDDETENQLAQLEGYVANIVNQIEEEGPDRLSLTALDKMRLCVFIGIQLLRAEKSIHEMTCNDYIDGYVRSSYTLIRPTQEDFHNQLLVFMKYMLNDGIYNWMNPQKPEYGQLTFDDIQVIGIPEALDASFILGDSVPIVLSKLPSRLDMQYSNSLVNPFCIKVMPVTPKIAIALFRDGMLSNVDAARLVQAINRTMFDECLSVAAYGRDSLELLLDAPDSKKTIKETLECAGQRFYLGN